MQPGRGAHGAGCSGGFASVVAGRQKLSLRVPLHDLLQVAVELSNRLVEQRQHLFFLMIRASASYGCELQLKKKKTGSK